MWLARDSTYRIAGNFRGIQFLWFTWLSGDPWKLNSWNKKAMPKLLQTTHVGLAGGVATVVGTLSCKHTSTSNLENSVCFRQLSSWWYHSVLKHRIYRPRQWLLLILPLSATAYSKWASWTNIWVFTSLSYFLTQRSSNSVPGCSRVGQ